MNVACIPRTKTLRRRKLIKCQGCNMMFCQLKYREGVSMVTRVTLVTVDRHDNAYINPCYALIYFYFIFI